MTHNRIGPCADDFGAAVSPDGPEHGTLMARLFPVSPSLSDQRARCALNPPLSLSSDQSRSGGHVVQKHPLFRPCPRINARRGTRRPAEPLALVPQNVAPDAIILSNKIVVMPQARLSTCGTMRKKMKITALLDRICHRFPLVTSTDKTTFPRLYPSHQTLLPRGVPLFVYWNAAPAPHVV